jgi:hypothetical protein
MDEFAGRDKGGVSDQRDEFAPPARLHLQDGESILLIVKRHPLNRAGEGFTRRIGVGGDLQGILPLLKGAEQSASNDA